MARNFTFPSDNLWGSREKKKLNTEFDLFRSVHGPEYSCLRTPPEPQHRFEVTIESSVFTEEKYVHA